MPRDGEKNIAIPVTFVPSGSILSVSQMRKSSEATLESAGAIHDDDGSLVRQAREGSRAAFDALFHRHKPFIYNVCCRMLGSVDDAVDVTQSAFIQAYRELRKFRGDASFRTWLYRIAVNLCVTFIRREQRQKRLAEATPIEPHRSSEDEGVWEAVLKLPPRHRAVLVLFHFQGLSCEETAKALGCSYGAVRTRLHRARIEFKKKYEELET